MRAIDSLGRTRSRGRDFLSFFFLFLAASFSLFLGGEEKLFFSLLFFLFFLHLVIVLVSGVTVSRRLGRRHARAFSPSILSFPFHFFKNKCIILISSLLLLRCNGRKRLYIILLDKVSLHTTPAGYFFILPPFRRRLCFVFFCRFHGDLYLCCNSHNRRMHIFIRQREREREKCRVSR